MHETRSSQPPSSIDLHTLFSEENSAAGAQVEHQQHFVMTASKPGALEILTDS